MDDDEAEADDQEEEVADSADIVHEGDRLFCTTVPPESEFIWAGTTVSVRALRRRG